jgi:hypothetical protein
LLSATKPTPEDDDDTDRCGRFICAWRPQVSLFLLRGFQADTAVVLSSMTEGDEGISHLSFP